jgi:hypothetical protein
MSEYKVETICVTIGIIAYFLFSYLSDKAKYEHQAPPPAVTSTIHAD